MRVLVSQITSVLIVYWTIWSGTDQRKHQSVTDLCEENSPVTEMFPFGDIIMLPMFYTTLEIEQSYDCPCVCAATLHTMGKLDTCWYNHDTKTKQKSVHILWDI